MTHSLLYDQFVFSGGGTRCFWHGGFSEAIAGHVERPPIRVASVSGGALAAAAYIADCERALLDNMTSAFAEQDSNTELHVLDDKKGLTPHQEIYRDVVRQTLGDDDTLARIADGPQFQVLLAHPPSETFDRLTGTLSTLIYEAELHLIGAPHFEWAEKAGLTTSFVDARQAARDGTLVDLVCAAATIPPLFELAQWNGKPVIDGGMADQAPLPDPDKGETLILLTRSYSTLPDEDTRTYVMPSTEVAADKIDFTDPQKIRDAWEQGRRDGDAWLQNKTQQDSQI